MSEVNIKTDWYDENIEENVRDLVIILRNNGINTECSCHHADPMFIQCQYLLAEEIKRIHDLVWLYLHEKQLPITFEINLRHKVVDSCTYTSLDIKIPAKYKT